MHKSISYPAKLMLFGEYTVITGSMAVAVPLRKFSGSWVNKRSQEDWPIDLHEFLDHLHQNNDKLHLDLPAMEKDLQEGWWFKSDIPTGFGVGSSGSFVAGLYDRYKTSTPKDLRDTLATIESFFHGQSSGLDPLISLTGRSIQIDSDGTYQFIENPDHSGMPFEIWLINSGRPRRTQPLVNRFKENLENPTYEAGISKYLNPLVNKLIGAFTNSSPDSSRIWEIWAELSDQQLKYFPEMIIPEVLEIWQEGLRSNSFKLKLCGAGGGGFFISMVKKEHRQDLQSALRGLEAFKVEF
jgi:mevalonate kinase